jgi:hypothetical protein
MQKYNFYVIQAKIRNGGDVPADLNDPVKTMLAESFKCPEAIEELADFEKHKNCGEIQIFDKSSFRNITVKTNYGMVEGYDLVKTINTDTRVIITKKHIKNPNLSMKKVG